MPERSLDSETLRLIGAFESATGVQPVDCVTSDRRVVFVVPGEKVGKAVGKGGRNVKRLKDRLDRHVQVVGLSDDPEEFVESYFFDVGVEEVRLEEDGDRTVAHVKVPPGEKARAIGRKGSNVQMASELTKRHHDVEVVID